MSRSKQHLRRHGLTSTLNKILRVGNCSISMRHQERLGLAALRFLCPHYTSAKRMYLLHVSFSCRNRFRLQQLAQQVLGIRRYTSWWRNLFPRIPKYSQENIKSFKLTSLHNGTICLTITEMQYRFPRAIILSFVYKAIHHIPHVKPRLNRGGNHVYISKLKRKYWTVNITH